MHLLIDLENVQPTPADVAKFIGADGRAWVFHSPQQVRRLPALKALGERVTLVPVVRSGNNALDFHLVFYLGHLAARHPAQEFVVLSRDTDYDIAIEHARMMMFSVRRIDSLQAQSAAPAEPLEARAKAPVKKAVPARKAAARKAPAAKAAPAAKPVKSAPTPAPAPAVKNTKVKTVEMILADALQMIRSGQRPARLTALERWVQARIGRQPAPEKVKLVVDGLVKAGAIRLVDGKLAYPGA